MNAYTNVGMFDPSLTTGKELITEFEKKFGNILFDKGSTGDFGEYKMVANTELKISRKWQRFLIKTTIQKAKRFSRQYCQPLVVYQRPNGDLVVVDGQHKLVMSLLGNDKPFDVPCVVFEHPKDRTLKDCEATEARLFEALNTARHSTSKIDKVRAGLAYGDKDAQQFEQDFIALGLQIEGIGDPDGVPVKGVAKAERGFKTFGLLATKRAVSFLRSAYTKYYNKNYVDGSMVGALAAVYNLLDVLGDGKKANGLKEYLNTYFHKIRLSDWTKNSSGPSENIIARRIVDKYNDMVKSGVIRGGAVIGEDTLSDDKVKLRDLSKI